MNTQQNKITFYTWSCGHKKHKRRGKVQHAIEKKMLHAWSSKHKNTKEGWGATHNK